MERFYGREIIHLWMYMPRTPAPKNAEYQNITIQYISLRAQLTALINVEMYALSGLMEHGRLRSYAQ